MEYKVSAIICAAGKGVRAGFNKNKLLAPLYGQPALYHTLKKLKTPEIDEVFVTSSKEDFAEISALCAPFGYTVVTGGATRTQSVKNALERVTGDIVLIHDGARPFVTGKLISKCIENVKIYGSGICAVKPSDTVASGALGVICDVPDRDGLYLLQTPQGFMTEDIKSAYALAGGGAFTDDSSVYRKFIGTPRIVEGEAENVKLTYKKDFENRLPPLPSAVGTRVGFGVDVHAFGKGNSVTLAGVKIQCGKSLIAHSDGDVAVHAVMDALLSAAGLKDIGHYFPDTDEKYLNADSCKMLEEVVQLIGGAGYKVSSLSVSVQAEEPKLAPYIDRMKENLSKITGTENVAISAGTCEGLGFVGERLGITAYCTALLNGKNYGKDN